MNTIWTKEFWKAAGERAIRTVCQTALSMIGVETVISNIDWKTVIISSVVAGVLSLVTSIATGLPECTGVNAE